MSKKNLLEREVTESRNWVAEPTFIQDCGYSCRIFSITDLCSTIKRNEITTNLNI